MSRRRLAALAGVWIGPSLILVLLTYCTYDHYRIVDRPRLDGDGRAAVIAQLRAGLEKRQVEPPTHPVLAQRLPDRGPIVVSVWLDGNMRARITAEGDTLGEAVSAANARLMTHRNLANLAASARERARIKVDVITGRGPLLRKGDRLARAVSATLDGVTDPKKKGHGSGLELEHVGMHPGIDGLGVSAGPDGKVTVLLPDELMRGGLLTAEQPLEFVPELKLGLNFKVANQSLAGLSGMGKDAFMAAERSYWRFHADAFVERPEEGRASGPPLPLTRNLPPRPELTADNLRAAAIAGGRYLVRHQAPNGRYVYEQNLSNGSATDPTKPGPYSLPRHAGVTYFLAELYRRTGEEFLKVPIERAFAHMQELVAQGGCEGTLPDGAEFSCVIDYSPNLDRKLEQLEAQTAAATGAERERLAAELYTLKTHKRAGLGSTALAVVSLAEYKRATDSDQYMPLARKMAEWILYMQRDDGSFRHIYEVPLANPVEGETLLYFSGEAALALARMYTVTGEERYLRAAEKALDWLVDWYDFFVGGFFYGEEHWTCIAAEAIYPAVQRDKYRTFCSGYGAFLRHQQFGPGDFPGQADLVGAYGVSPFVMPHNTPAGSRSEAMISAYLLGKYHGKPDHALREQVLAAMHYLLGQQIREDSSWDVSPKAMGVGAIPGTPTDRVVRIDYVQHVCSALLRSIDVLDGG